MKRILLFIALLCALSGAASAQVSLAPFVKGQWFDNSGHPLSGGRIYTYIAGTTTALATYRDSQGLIPNTNPVILDSAGRADIWLTGVAYKLVLTNSSGVQIWSEDNIPGSTNSLLGLNNIWTGQNTWNSTATFNSSVTFNSGFTSSGPNNMSGGGILNGTWTGTPTFAGTPNFTNGFVSTTGSFSGPITSTVATGTSPFNISSTTQVPNLNASLLQGCTWASPCPIGGTVPNTAIFTSLKATNFTLGVGIPLTGVQGSDVNIMTSGTVTGTAGTGVCLDANLGLTTTGCGIGASKIQAVTYCASGCVVTGTPCTTTGSSFDTCDNNILWPASFADANYSATCNGVGPVDGSNPTTGRVNLQVVSQNTLSVNVRTVTLGSSSVKWTQINCTGVHP
jgi:hypothetical protein